MEQNSISELMPKFPSSRNVNLDKDQTNAGETINIFENLYESEL